MSIAESPIAVKKLVKEYRGAKHAPLRAVDGISFDVKEGECFGLLGPNGAGKSTSMQCITGFYPPTSGEVRLLGVDVHAEPRRARLHLGVCSQEDTLDSDFSVLDQMVRYGTYFGCKPDEGLRPVPRPFFSGLIWLKKVMNWWNRFPEGCAAGCRSPGRWCPHPKF